MRPYKESSLPLPELFRGPRVPDLRYVIHADVEEAAAALERGAVDMVDYPVPSPSRFEGDDITLDECRDFGYYYFACNCGSGATRHKSFRQAMAFLLDFVKKEVAGDLESGRLELMNSIMVDYYGRLVNRYLPDYSSPDRESAVRRALAAMEDFRFTEDGLIDPDGQAVEDGSVICLITTDLPTTRRIMESFRALVEGIPQLGRLFEFVEVNRLEQAERVYAKGTTAWNLFAGWQYVQDNLSRWNPGMSKLRLSLDWTCDFQSGFSETRNYPQFSDPEYDRAASGFLSQVFPHDIRGAVIAEEHLEPRWNNPEFWADGGEVTETDTALLLLWKVQHALAEACPVIPLLARSVQFARRSEIEGIFNGRPGEAFTVPGHGTTIEATYPGGTMSYWTFQRAQKKGKPEEGLTLGVSSPLRHLNPLGIGNYWDAVIWSRIYESLLGLNPYLLMKGVAEDCVNLAESFQAHLVNQGEVREIIHYDLRPEAQWHDGEPFTADDPAFTYLSMLGLRGREIAARHPSTEHLVEALVNEREIASWVDYASWIHHLEIHDPHSIEVHLTGSSRFPHEWFGDMPILPMHVWRHLGKDFMQPTYGGVTGLYRIVDEARGAGGDGRSPWNGLVGTGPFRWDCEFAKSHDPLTQGGRLLKNERYHYSDLIREN